MIATSDDIYVGSLSKWWNKNQRFVWGAVAGAATTLGAQYAGSKLTGDSLSKQAGLPAPTTKQGSATLWDKTVGFFKSSGLDKKASELLAKQTVDGQRPMPPELQQKLRTASIFDSLDMNTLLLGVLGLGGAYYVISNKRRGKKRRRR